MGRGTQQLVNTIYTSPYTFLPVGTILTSSGDTGWISGFGEFRSAFIFINITTISGTTPTLDVYIDGTPDGIEQMNMIHFIQATTTPFKRTGILIESYPSSFSGFGPASLAADLSRGGPFGEILRCRWVITGTTPSYTITCKGIFKS